MEIIPALKENKRDADAKKMFDPVYQQQRDMLNEDPDSAEQMNNLAWLCARTDERLDEALKLSQRAVSLAPDNYAYIDTLAECNFRVGNFKEAVELETKAMEMRPADEFIQEQLVRFRKGKE
jgi:tetratricopeptide (TPR) repeat protein